MKRKLIYSLPLVMSLSACGVSVDNVEVVEADEPDNLVDDARDAVDTGAVSVLITDNLSTEYSEVWVTIKEVKAVSAGNKTVTLYDDPVGEAYNLSQLVDVGALLNQRLIPAGDYDLFKVELANRVTLVRADGSLTHSVFSDYDDSIELNVPGSLSVSTLQHSTVALDFDLKQFTYDPLSNIVSPVVVQKSSDQLGRVYADIDGYILTIDSPTQFVIEPEHGGAPISVTLHSTATVTDDVDYRNGVGTDSTNLKIGDKVDIYGNFDAVALELEAVRVAVETNASNSFLDRVEVKGNIVSFDGSSLVLDVREADFIPDSNTLNIANVTNAIFSKGDLNLISAGQTVEIRGSWDGTTMSALVIEIEGAKQNTDSSSFYLDDYAEVEGRIESFNDAGFTLSIDEIEHSPDLINATQVSVMSQNAWFKTGAANCLNVGDKLEIKGAINYDLSLSASTIEVEQGCGLTDSSDDSSSDDRDDDSSDDSSSDDRDDDSNDGSSSDDRDDDSNDDSSSDDRDDDSNDDSSSDDRDDDSNDDSSSDDRDDDSNDDSSSDDRDDDSNDDSSSDDRDDDSNDDSSSDDRDDDSNDDSSSDDSSNDDSSSDDSSNDDSSSDDSSNDDSSSDDSSNDDSSSDDSSNDDSSSDDSSNDDSSSDDSSNDDSSSDDSSNDDSSSDDSSNDDSSSDDSSNDDSSSDDSSNDDSSSDDSSNDDSSSDDSSSDDSSSDDSSSDGSSSDDSSNDERNIENVDFGGGNPIYWKYWRGW